MAQIEEVFVSNGTLLILNKVDKNRSDVPHGNSIKLAILDRYHNSVFHIVAVATPIDNDLYSMIPVNGRAGYDHVDDEIVEAVDKLIGRGAHE